MRYQLGTADISTIDGKEFDAAVFKKIPKFFFVGSQDEDDAVPYLYSYTYEDRITIFKLFGKDHLERYRKIENIFIENGFDCKFKIYQGIGHTISDQFWTDIYNFIKENIDK